MLFAALIGWVFFRATDLSMAAGVLQRMFVPQGGTAVPDSWPVAFALLVAGVWATLGPNIYDLNYDRRAWKVAVTALAFGVALAIIAGDRSSPFLYFQF